MGFAGPPSKLVFGKVTWLVETHLNGFGLASRNLTRKWTLAFLSNLLYSSKKGTINGICQRNVLRPYNKFRMTQCDYKTWREANFADRIAFAEPKISDLNKQ